MNGYMKIILPVAIIFIIGMTLFHDDVLRSQKEVRRPAKLVTTLTCQIAYFTVSGTDETLVGQKHPKDAGYTVVKIHGVEDYDQVIRTPHGGSVPYETRIKVKALDYGANYAYVHNVNLITANYQYSTGRIE